MTGFCPQCGGNTLHRVRQPGNSALNRDQFDAIKAGDWYCDACPDNGRGNTGLCYWWDNEVPKPALTIDELAAQGEEALSPLLVARIRAEAFEAAANLQANGGSIGRLAEMWRDRANRLAGK